VHPGFSWGLLPEHPRGFHPDLKLGHNPNYKNAAIKIGRQIECYCSLTAALLKTYAHAFILFYLFIFLVLGTKLVCGLGHGKQTLITELHPQPLSLLV
jgi:hypothetical protein